MKMQSTLHLKPVIRACVGSAAKGVTVYGQRDEEHCRLAAAGGGGGGTDWHDGPALNSTCNMKG
jgi:hypothetical protein